MSDSLRKIVKISSYLLALALLLLFGLFFFSKASAASITWDGGGGDNNWSTAANWTGDVAPGSSDIAIFDGTSTKNATIDASINVAGIDINSGYTGVITQGSGFTVTVGASNFDISDGTFTGGDATITIANNFLVTGGTFTSTTGTLDLQRAFTVSSGTFEPSTGTVQASSTAHITWDVNATETFNNLTFAKGHLWKITMGSGDIFVVTGTLTLTNGLVNTGTIDAQGDISQGGSFDGGSAIIEFAGAGAQTYTMAGGITPKIELDSAADASDSLVLAANTTITALTITSDFSGTIPISNGGDFVLTFTSWNQAAGTIDASAQTNWNIKNLTVSAGTFTPPATVTAKSGTATWNVNTTETFDNLTINPGNLFVVSISGGDTLVVTGTLTLTNGKINTGTIDAQGDIYQGGSFDGGSAIIEFAGAGAQTYTLNGGISPWIQLDSAADASDSLTFTANTTITDLSITSDFSGTIPISNVGDFTPTFTKWNQAAGTIDASAQTNWSIKNLTISAGTFTPPETVTAVKGAAFWNVNVTETFNNLNINKSNNFVLGVGSGDTFVVTGTATFTNGKMNTAIVDARGNVTMGSSYDGGTATLLFSGNAVQTFDLSAGTWRYNGDIKVNKSGGSVVLASALVMDANNQDLLIEEGVLNLAGNTLFVNGSSGLMTVESGGTLQLYGSEAFTLNANQPTLNTGSTVIYTGDGDAIADSYTLTTLKDTYHHLTINSTDGATDTFNLGAAIDINGDFSNSGTFDVTASNYAVNLAGDWENTGTFTGRAGTVTLDGTSQALSGATTFYAFSKIVAAADTLTFPASVTQTFAGTMTLQGASGQLLSLVSSSPSTQAKIDPQGTRSVQYADVQDNNNVNASSVTCSPGCINSGNNTNWGLPGVTVSAISGNTTESLGQATFTVVLDQQPASDVTTTIVSSNTNEGTVDKALLTFTNGNWSDAQTVTVTGVNDDVDDGDIGYTITTGSTSSGDSGFNGINPENVSVTNTDNDTVGITVSAISGDTTEGGGTATFTVVLDTEPTNDVTIAVSSDNTDEGTVDKALLTFTSGDWSDAQTVTVTGVDDSDIDGNIDYSIVLAEAASVDGLYDVINPSDVSVTNTDNDTTPSGGSFGPSPSNVSVSISGIESCDPDTAINLEVSGYNIKEVLISNNAFYSGVQWRSFNDAGGLQSIPSQSFDWSLEQVDVSQVVYVLFRSASGATQEVQTESINLGDYPACEILEPDVPVEEEETVPVEDVEATDPLDDFEDQDEVDELLPVLVLPGFYIRTANSHDVYFITEELERRPFYTDDMYLTYESSFDAVVIVPDFQLSDFPLVAPMVPKPEAALVKFQSLSQVYVAREEGEYIILRHIPSEELASSLYGKDWANRIIEIPPPMWTLYLIGGEISEDYEVMETPMLFINATTPRDSFGISRT